MKRKRKHILEGTIRLPEHQRITFQRFEGARVGFLSRYPDGRTEVKLLETLSPQFQKGHHLTLLPGCFIKKEKI